MSVSVRVPPAGTSTAAKISACATGANKLVAAAAASAARMLVAPLNRRSCYSGDSVLMLAGTARASSSSAISPEHVGELAPGLFG